MKCPICKSSLVVTKNDSCVLFVACSRILDGKCNYHEMVDKLPGLDEMLANCVQAVLDSYDVIREVSDD